MDPIEILFEDTTCYLIKIDGYLAYVVHGITNEIRTCNINEVKVTDRGWSKMINQTCKNS
jgi:hypothetical protein